MGLYDKIYMKAKCPYCKQTSEMEFQTKDGSCFMNVYRQGDKFENGKFRRIDAIGSCESLICQIEAAKESVWTQGYYGGFSRSFYVYIYCDSRGRITKHFRVYRLNFHRGIMKGKLGELKGKEDNMKVVRYTKKGKIIPAKLKSMTTDGWADKFKDDSFDNGKETYKAIMYLYNLEDGVEAFKLWFLFRYKTKRIIERLTKELKIKLDEEFASVFLSNEPLDIYELSKTE